MARLAHLAPLGSLLARFSSSPSWESSFSSASEVCREVGAAPSAVPV